MKKYMLLFSLPLLLSLSKPVRKKVVFFGDSITELGARPGGYIPRIDSLARLEDRSADFEFVGAGVSGNKVYDLYLRLEEDVLKKEPDVVVIYIGINDVWHKVSSGTGTDVDRFERFYTAIIKKLKEKNIRVILCTPSVIGERNDSSNQQDGDLNFYSRLVRNMAAKNSLELVDLRQRLVAETPLGRVDDAFEGEVVGGLRDDTQIGERVADFLSLVKAEAADDAIGQADRDEAVFELAGLVLCADQDGDVVQVGAASLRRLDLVAESSHWPLPTRSDAASRADAKVQAAAWADVCAWVRDHVPADACFLTPRGAGSFTWRTDRREVVSWKNSPRTRRRSSSGEGGSSTASRGRARSPTWSDPRSRSVRHGSSRWPLGTEPIT